MANKNITGSKVSVNKIVFGEMILITNKHEKTIKMISKHNNGGTRNTK